METHLVNIFFQMIFTFVLKLQYNQSFIPVCIFCIEEHYAHAYLCVCFCLCLVCIFFQCSYFQNIFPPGSLQAVETLLEISPASFIMLLLPLAIFPLQKVIF